jgi:hypothetical protein
VGSSASLESNRQVCITVTTSLAEKRTKAKNSGWYGKATRRLFPAKKALAAAPWAEASVILEGVENDSTTHSTYRTVHGAGYVMDRLEAKGKTDRKTGQVLRAGKVTPEMMHHWAKRARVELPGLASMNRHTAVSTSITCSTNTGIPFGFCIR